MGKLLNIKFSNDKMNKMKLNKIFNCDNKEKIDISFKDNQKKDFNQNNNSKR